MSSVGFGGKPDGKVVVHAVAYPSGHPVAGEKYGITEMRVALLDAPVENAPVANSSSLLPGMQPCGIAPKPLVH